MLKIKFSHSYNKIGLAFKPTSRYLKTATLLDVINVKLEDLSFAFLGYDTTYYEKGKLENYKLPKKGDYLLLIFLGECGIFTTLRRQVPAKELYYRDKIGDVFEVIIE